MWLMIMAIAEENNTSTYAVVLVLAALLVLAGVMVWKLLHTKLVEAKPDTKTRIVAKKDLAAFAFLQEGDLELLAGTAQDADAGAQKPPTIGELKGHYLIVNVKRGGEVKPEMVVAPSEPTATLDDAVAVSLPATPTSTLGGQLRAGDVIDVFAGTGTPSSATAADQTKIRTFEKLMVLNIAIKKEAKADEKGAGEPGVLTLAVPRDRCVDFAAAVAGGTVLVTRRIPTKK